ncbi:Na+/H+ antiporter NhaA [Inmirania thermothiophila]|uniref:Na(+)/H(+) antiporter NhaA n=1 Tax=Inmirania thermothiophila TaxID=1750597 RepID=A0A3N1Y1E2_9GAMM|nr:Na+/H+ antiporter NhaA [Inmirania thermothiophila]ROR32654.1 sodium/proton antiporter (NhaA family) [Inmirania thermothiophila]
MSGRVQEMLADFLRTEAGGAVLLLAAAVLALGLANSPLAGAYEALLTTPVAVRVGALEVAKPLLLWINDGLMAVFFVLVGLEVKREALEGELRGVERMVLPALAALGGMAGPALVYVAVNWGDPVALNGWAIPAATDIAFALGVLSLLGTRVPPAVKIFLLSLAIFDDLGAIVVIALFYSGDLSGPALAFAGLGAVVLAALNLAGVRRLAPYVLTGVFLWVSVLKSGVHATLAGVAVGLAIPMRAADGSSPLKEVEHALHRWVAYGILPLFGFANAGIGLGGAGLAHALHPVNLGIALGLVLGKPLGVAGTVWLAVRAGLVRLPRAMTPAVLWGIGVLCGMGFTMSLFIGSLAFEHAGEAFAADYRVGVVAGSLVAGAAGYLLLRRALPRPS